MTMRDLKFSVDRQIFSVEEGTKSKMALRMPLKRKPISETAIQSPSDDEDDEDFELGLLDDTLSSDEDSDEDDSGDDAQSESGENSDGTEESDEQDLTNGESKSKDVKLANGTDGTESENLLSDVSSESYSSDSDIVLDPEGNPRKLLPEIDPHYDSDSSTSSEINTIGNIDIEKYYPASMPHIGYDINGRRIMRPAAGAALDQLLETIDLPKGWTGIVDKETGQLKNLTDEELEIIKRIRRQELPNEETEIYDPYRFPEEDPFPLSSAPEPKRRFLPSKHEAIRIMKIVRAIRQGKIVRKPPPKPRAQTASYDIWSSDPPKTQQDVKIPTTQRIPAPKLKLPEHDESYNPPAEYIPTEEERKEWEELDEEDREKNYLSKKYGSLRLVPAWAEFVKERFERCLDLYLAPRVQKNRLNINPDSLIPKLPSPRDLRPFPTRIGVVYEGHTSRIRATSIDPTGLWVATGSDDGSVRIWELATGREIWKWMYPHHGQDDVVYAMSWNPVKEIGVLVVAVGDIVYLLIPPVWSVQKTDNTREVCEKGFHAEGTNKNELSDVKWSRGRSDDIALIVKTQNTIRHITWHRRGDYFATVAPQGTSGKSVLIHQLSRHQTQSPFSRQKGTSIQSLVFHPVQPQIFVASRQSITHYSLTPPQLIRKLRPGVKFISSLDIHPLGDHLIVGSYDKRVAWFDLDLSDRPYKTLRFAERAVRDVTFHKGGVKCFASASDEGVVQVFWADVRAEGSVDVNPTIVPLKVLRGHRVVDSLGVMGVEWHPRLAWLVSAGADGKAILWT